MNEDTSFRFDARTDTLIVTDETGEECELVTVDGDRVHVLEDGTLAIFD